MKVSRGVDTQADVTDVTADVIEAATGAYDISTAEVAEGKADVISPTGLKQLSAPINDVAVKVAAVQPSSTVAPAKRLG